METAPRIPNTTYQPPSESWIQTVCAVLGEPALRQVPPKPILVSRKEGDSRKTQIIL